MKLLKLILVLSIILVVSSKIFKKNNLRGTNKHNHKLKKGVIFTGQASYAAAAASSSSYTAAAASSSSFSYHTTIESAKWKSFLLGDPNSVDCRKVRRNHH